MSDLPRVWRRKGLRRPFRAYCDAISLDDGRRIGQRIVDLSPRGALIAMDDHVAVGDTLLVIFQMPWLGPIVHTRAVVERVVEGWRQNDPGYCAGVRFEGMSARDRLELIDRLSQFPATTPTRRHPTDYARAVWRIGVGLDEDLGAR